jgi:hypothetical protein
VGSKNESNEDKEEELREEGLVFEEGGDIDGVEHRKEKGVPETEAARKKHFLNVEQRKTWEWEGGRTYGCDFFNPYLDFNGESSFRGRKGFRERGNRLT